MADPTKPACPLARRRVICQPMTRAKPLILAALTALAALPAAAHPHIFIDTGQQLIFDDTGQLAAIRTIWIYDEFYSLLTLEDRGLDPDGDGLLTPAEHQTLAGFDMNWDAGFDGDTYALQNDQPLKLSRPVEFNAEYKDGKIITTHLRAFESRVDLAQGPVVIKAYDPTYYTAYTIAIPAKIENRTGCTAPIFTPDPTKASAQLMAALSELNATQTLDDLQTESFPAIGEDFAQFLTLTCKP